MMQVAGMVEKAKKANEAVDLLKNTDWRATLLAFYYHVNALK